MSDIGNGILQEDGAGRILLENGSGIILLESAPDLAISFNNYLGVSVGDGMSATEKAR